ncbi:5033_t:CDS:2, partial [Funneliformis geosporum]
VQTMLAGFMERNERPTLQLFKGIPEELEKIAKLLGPEQNVNMYSVLSAKNRILKK